MTACISSPSNHLRTSPTWPPFTFIPHYVSSKEPNAAKAGEQLINFNCSGTLIFPIHCILLPQSADLELGTPNGKERNVMAFSSLQMQKRHCKKPIIKSN